MPVVIVGTGRSGTTMAVEILRCSSLLVASDDTEDSGLFERCDLVCSNYLTKCDTSYINDKNKIRAFFDKNISTKFVWCIRDPRDMALSKIFRGQPGQDSIGLCKDATQETCLDHINYMFDLYKYTAKNFNNDIMVLRMEDVILDFDNVVYKLCDFVKILFDEKMRQFYLNYRVIPKKERYKSIDQSQVGMWKNWQSVYNGFFNNNPNYDISKLFKELEPVCKEFGYV